MKSKEKPIFSYAGFFLALFFVMGIIGLYIHFTSPTKFVLECNQIDKRLSSCQVIEPLNYSDDFRIMRANICTNGTYIQSLTDCAKRSFYYGDCEKISQEGENIFISYCHKQ